MANRKHFALLEQQVEAWNNWRKNNPEIRPDLSGANLKEKDLTGANFSYADIRGADFSNANLKDVNFTHAEAGLRIKICLVIVSLVLSAILGFTTGIFGIFAGIMLSPEYTSKYTFFPAVSVLVVFLILSIATILRGIVAPLVFLAVIFLVLVVGGYVGIYAFQGALAVVGASTYFVVSLIFGGFAFTLAGILQGALLVASAVIVAVIFAAFFIIAAVTAAGANDHFIFVAVAGAAPIAAVGAIAGLMLSGYVAWRALTGDEKYAFLRKTSIAFAAIGGTSFRNANLTDANFTNATLKSTDFRKANLTRTCWRNENAKQLDRVRPGTTYLQNAQVRQLVITGEGKNKNFDRLDLRGLNLREANLENASFIDADLYQANLSNANLSRAILVRTNFERADLRGACLTGSCIQDWIISRGTKLDKIVCDYVYLKWVNGDKRDQMPHRDKFKKGGFVLFAKYILDTIDIYHNKDINPRLALTVLKKMSRDYDEPLDIVAIGKRGDEVFIKVKLSETVEPEQFKENYFSRYEDSLKLISSSSKALPSVDELVENKLTEIASDKTDEISSIINVTHIEYLNTSKYLLIQGEVTVETIETGRDTINQSGNFGIGHMSGGEIKDNAKVAGVINEASQQNLAETVAEIEALIQQLEQSHPTNTTTEQMMVATQAIAQIESNPTWKQKAIAAFKQGSLKAIETHPVGAFIVGAIKGWQEPQVK